MWKVENVECRRCGESSRSTLVQTASIIHSKTIAPEILLEGKMNSTKVCRRIGVTSWPCQQFLKSATDAVPRLPENFVTHHTISWRRFQPRLNFRTGKRAEKPMLSV